MRGRDADAARRYVERKRLEDEAPRLIEQMPSLESLRLEIRELRASGAIAESMHVREIVVPRAPALFVLPCREPSCQEGGHDITAVVLRALRTGATQFEGEDECMGQIKERPCGRIVRFSGTARYRAE